MTLNSKLGMSLFVALFLGLTQVGFAKSFEDKGTELGKKVDKAEAQVRDKGQEIADAAREKAQEAKDKASDAKESAKEKAKDAIDKM